MYFLSNFKKAVCLFFLLLACNPIAAEEVSDPESELSVVALFNKAAMIKYQGKQKMLRAGQRLNKEILLISANSKQAVFEIQGRKVIKRIGEGSQFGAAKQLTGPQKTVRIVRDAGGMFRTSGTINNLPVRFLVDTGASSIAMNENIARQLGLQYELYGQPMQSHTAGGIMKAWSVVLEKVTVGTITLRNVQAAVIRGYPSNEVLLGNTFLSQLKIEHSGTIMVLSTHY